MKISFAAALGLIFIVLKLTHFIDWSWLWVLAPFWIGIALWGAFIGILALFSFIAVIIKSR